MAPLGADRGVASPRWASPSPDAPVALGGRPRRRRRPVRRSAATSIRSSSWSTPGPTTRAGDAAGRRAGARRAWAGASSRWPRRRHRWWPSSRSDSGSTVPAGADPVALVDDAVGWWQGRFSVRRRRSRRRRRDGPGPRCRHGPRPAGRRSRRRATTATAATTRSRPPPSPAPATTSARRDHRRGRGHHGADRAGRAHAVVVGVVVVAPRRSPSSRRLGSSWWVPAGDGGAVAVAGAARRRGSRCRAPADSSPTAAPPSRAPCPPPRRSPAPDVGRRLPLHRPVRAAPVGRRRGPGRGGRSWRGVAGRARAQRAQPRRRRADAAQRRELSSAAGRVLALAEELGNVSEACRIVGVSRRSYYEWKRIADEHGRRGAAAQARARRTP